KVISSARAHQSLHCASAYSSWLNMSKCSVARQNVFRDTQQDHKTTHWIDGLTKPTPRESTDCRTSRLAAASSDNRGRSGPRMTPGATSKDRLNQNRAESCVWMSTFSSSFYG